MGFFAFFNCYTLRINLSVAIVAMVNATYLRELEAASDSDNETSGARWSCDDSDGRTAQKSNATNIHQVRSLASPAMGHWGTCPPWSLDM